MQDNLKAATKREQSGARIDSAERGQARPMVKYVNLSWAVVGICEDSRLPLSALVHEGDNIEEAVGHYVIGYLAFWHIAFVDE